LPEEAMTIARILKKTIQTNVGDYITCSIGIAPNRYLAKIASNMQKPDGLVIIRPDELPEALYKLKLNALPGIGAKTQERILKSGISSIEELCKLDAIKLKTTWGECMGRKGVAFDPRS
jgi:DNA polymerase-4